MMEKKMKKINLLILFSLFVFSCNDVSLSNPQVLIQEAVIAVKIEPPVTCPGCSIEISAAINNGSSEAGVGDISVGNIVFTQENQAKLEIPADISNLFGDSANKALIKKGYVDVPVNIKIAKSEKSAVKYFRIAGKDYKKSKFDVNPVITSLTYEAIGSAEKTEIARDSTIYFQPISIPEEISIEIKDLQIDDLIKDEYYFSWFISGNSEIIPTLTDFDKTTGHALFSFRDDSGAPIVGDFRFYLIFSPKKAYQGTESARYSLDFYSFVINTKGEPLEEDDADALDNTDNTLSDEDIDTISE